MPFALHSPAFKDGARIPEKFTRDGQNLSPPLAWSGAPDGTESFALIVEDPDAPSGVFRHWGVYNIWSSVEGLTEAVDKATEPRLGFQAVNDFGDPFYDGPDPPPGDPPHRYRFRLLALDVSSLDLDLDMDQAPSLTVADVADVAERHALGEAVLVGLYR